MNPEMARAHLRANQLRITAPRISVLCALANAKKPLSYTEVVEQLSGENFDPATVYRNLIKLKEAGIASVVSRVDGVSRYVLAISDQKDHSHPHFVCDDCGDISRLPEEFTISMNFESPWSTPVRLAQVQLRGECPDCLGTE